jgi:hypothetical protein
MPEETISKKLKKRASVALRRHVQDAPPLAPDLLYTFENGTAYLEPTVAEGAFIPDHGFDGPA